jgi:hypothetical protein
MISTPFSNDWAVRSRADYIEFQLESEIRHLTRKLSKLNVRHRPSLRKRESYAKRIRAKQAKLVTLKMEQ